MKDIDRLEAALLETEVVNHDYLKLGPRDPATTLLRIIAAFDRDDVVAASNALLKRHRLKVVK
jgi:hypothetical protein